MKNHCVKSHKKCRFILHLLSAFLLVAASFIMSLPAISQNVGINENGMPADASAGLDVDFNNKGLLLPRLTTSERDAIQSPAMSLLIFNTQTECFEAWNSNTSSWVAFGCISNTPGSIDCGDVLTDSRDGKTYQTLQIGSQCWMKENLNYVSPNSHCNSCDTYGRLYTWAGAMDGSVSSELSPSGVQGVCPDGWHLPSDAEWSTLEDQLNPDAGLKMKVTSGDNPSWDGTNASGFSALPAGFYNTGYYSFEVDADFWSTTENEADALYAWVRTLGTGNDEVVRYSGNKIVGFSIRCIKD